MGIQSSRAEANEDTKLYPSWYKANSWQVPSPSVALSDDPAQVPDCPPLVVRDPPPQCPPPQPQFQQAFPLPAWMGAGFLPMASETPASHFGRVTSETPSGLLHQTGDRGSDVGEHSANPGSMITISPQVSLPLWGLGCSCRPAVTRPSTSHPIPIAAAAAVGSAVGSAGSPALSH